MFEEYLQDAYEFYEMANAVAKTSKDREARRYYRASVFYTAGAVESFINYIGDAFAKAENLTPHEIAFLNDKTLYFSSDKDMLIEKVDYQNSESKIKFLIKKFAPDFDFETNPSWSKYSQFKKFRNSLVHPRQNEDETSVSDYERNLRSGISGVIEVMNVVSKGVFKKPLRKQILDLIPD